MYIEIIIKSMSCIVIVRRDTLVLTNNIIDLARLVCFSILFMKMCIEVDNCQEECSLTLMCINVVLQAAVPFRFYFIILT